MAEEPFCKPIIGKKSRKWVNPAFTDVLGGAGVQLSRTPSVAGGADYDAHRSGRTLQVLVGVDITHSHGNKSCQQRPGRIRVGARGILMQAGRILA